MEKCVTQISEITPESYSLLWPLKTMKNCIIYDSMYLSESIENRLSVVCDLVGWTIYLMSGSKCKILLSSRASLFWPLKTMKIV